MNASDITTVEDFFAFVEEVQGQPNYRAPEAFAVGVGLKIGDELVAAQYPVVNVGVACNAGAAALLSHAVRRTGQAGTFELSQPAFDVLAQGFGPFKGDGQDHSNIRAIEAAAQADGEPEIKTAARPVPIVTVINDLQEEALDAADVYLRLHLLSHRAVKPNEINLDGIFGKVETLAWTSQGVLRPSDAQWAQTEMLANWGQPLQVICLDKFPPMLMMVVPEGVRIADGQRVRLGAYLAEGTTVMHEGFCNFNAGTLGKSMVEGRISAGVVVGAGSDIGGGASIMGTLSGGNNTVVSVGEDCLQEANSGLGIPIGDRVRVAVGDYIKGSTLVRINRWGWEGNSVAQAAIRRQGGGKGTTHFTIKASELAGISDAVFRRNDKDGVMEVIPRGSSTWGSLNEALHDN